MKPAQIWIPGAEFQPVTHLFQAKFCAQVERHRAAVSLQPTAQVMVFLKQARSHRRVFDTGDDPDITTAFVAGFTINLKYPL